MIEEKFVQILQARNQTEDWSGKLEAAWSLDNTI